MTTTATPHHRPVTLLVWDAPNMDCTLHDIAGRKPLRPDLRAATSWLSGVARAGDDLLAKLFVHYHPDRQRVVAPFVHAARCSGFDVFPRAEERDIDDVFTATTQTYLDGWPAGGTLILATHDQALAAPLGDTAIKRGWRVAQLGYTGVQNWSSARSGWHTFDLEAIPGAFRQPLGRRTPADLPAAGGWLPSLIPADRHLRPRRDAA